MDMLQNAESRLTILVVENAQLVRKLTCRILEAEGFTTLQAPGGQEALTLALGYPKRIDLLLTDIHMPSMNGPDLAIRFTALRPSTAVLLMSGEPKRMTEKLGYHSIQKPFLAAELIANIKALIATPSANPEKT
jgi:two-component system cell cycle sensor histidine kinase/response regulator CckA